MHCNGTLSTTNMNITFICPRRADMMFANAENNAISKCFYAKHKCTRETVYEINRTFQISIRSLQTAAIRKLAGGGHVTTNTKQIMKHIEIESPVAFLSIATEILGSKITSLNDIQKDRYKIAR